jgi:hypothetical protein
VTSTLVAALATMAVLALVGLAPAVAMSGLRLVTVPVVPLAGAVVAAASATCSIAVGGSLLAWFVIVAVVVDVIVALVWLRWPGRRPWSDDTRRDLSGHPSTRLAGIIGALAVLGTTAWSLRGLATPTVGFDARAIWLIRGGWFLQSHQQLLIKMRVPNVGLIQSAYPPLVSACTALAWRITGNYSLRLGVVVIALLNACALVAAALALVEAGRRMAVRQGRTTVAGDAPTVLSPVVPLDWRQWVPIVVGVVTACLLVVISFGVTEPFMTNGYADPIWSLAAVGAVAYGLQSAGTPANRGLALVLLLVAGMSKNEGLVTAVALIVLVFGRALLAMSSDERRRHWWHPVATGASALAALAAWPLVMRIIHARGDSTTLSPTSDLVSRAHASFDGMAPYLHDVVLAAPIAAIGGLALSAVRRRGGLANDWWAWAALASGLLAVGGAFVSGTGAIQSWLVSTVHRVTEFPALTAWWIIAFWALVASVSLTEIPDRDSPSDAGPAASDLLIVRSGATTDRMAETGATE